MPSELRRKDPKKKYKKEKFSLSPVLRSSDMRVIAVLLSKPVSGSSRSTTPMDLLPSVSLRRPLRMRTLESSVKKKKTHKKEKNKDQIFFFSEQKQTQKHLFKN